VSSSTWIGGALAYGLDFLRMQSEFFRLHSTERANNHVEQDQPIFFARDAIGIAYNQLSAMFTSTSHRFAFPKKKFKYQTRRMV
jgi:hypothetical protein